MAYSQSLAARVRFVCGGLRGVVEKRMFGGVCFLLEGNLLVGIWQNSLIARVGASRYAELLKEPYADEFNVTGHAMTGWIMVEPDGIESDVQLRTWIDRSLEFVSTLPPKSSATARRSKRAKRHAKTDLPTD
jgi:TfoX/Sxy family transcriptional regulator of competence genes